VRKGNRGDEQTYKGTRDVSNTISGNRNEKKEEKKRMKRKRKNTDTGQGTSEFNDTRKRTDHLGPAILVGGKPTERVWKAASTD
jgi:hypothetical protein